MTARALWALFAGALALVATLTVGASAQIGGKPVKGNPTPGTAQPDPPDLADRVTLTGCVQMAPGRNAASASSSASSSSKVDPNTPSDARFILASAERQTKVPSGTGGSDLAAGTSSPTYRLEAIESQLSAFVGAKVEVSGEIKPRAASSRGEAVDAPTLQVEFVQKIAASCL
jgi:hypothetical protein